MSNSVDLREHAARLRQLRKQYPHVFGYITKFGILRAEETTLKTWEFEAEICDRVLELFPTLAKTAACPYCQGRLFRVGKDILVDFSVPFVDGFRVQVQNSLSHAQTVWIRCESCQMARILDKIQLGDGRFAWVRRTTPPVQTLIEGECPECKQTPCKHTAPLMFKPLTRMHLSGDDQQFTDWSSENE